MLQVLVPSAGLEPAIFTLEGCRSIQLSYEGVERVRGIEPLFSVWKTDVLPLNYTRLSHKLVGVARLERATSRSQSVRSSQLSYTPTWCRGGGSVTS